MSMWDYYVQAGKEGLRHRVFGYTATEGPTLGVGINANPTAYTAAEGTLCIDNAASVNTPDNQIVMPVCISMLCTVAGNGTFWALRFQTDTATQFSTGGTTLGAIDTYVDTTSGFTRVTAKGAIHFGDLTLVTGTSRQTVWECGLAQGSTAAFEVGDVLEIVFGAFGERGQGSRGGTAAVTGKFRSIGVPPVWIGRQSSLVMQMLGTIASTAPSFTPAVVTLELGHPRQTS